MGPATLPAVRMEVIEADGLTFETDTAGAGSRFALLLHGFPENKYSWRFQLPMLAEFGFTAWAPNLRGYGWSSRPSRRAAYGLDQLIGDVQALFAAAEKRQEITERVLIGHDWGAIIGWACAIRAAVPLDRLVVMNVPHPAVMRARMNSLTQLRKSWYAFFFQLPWLPEIALGRNRADAIAHVFRAMARDRSNFTDADLEVYRRSALRPGALTAMLNYYRAAAFNKTVDRISQSSVRSVEVPTLMIWGEEDDVLGKELTYGTENYVRDLTIRCLPGVSHWVQQEAPHSVNQMLGAFLEGRPVPTADEMGR